MALVGIHGVLVVAVGCGPSSSAPDGGSSSPEATGATVPAPYLPGPLSYDTPFIVAGIRTPQVEPAEVADLSDDARVIGVSVATRHRAYSVAALSGMTSHVVNDMIDGVPVSVTYCNQTDCARVLTTDEQNVAIDLWIGGWMQGQMTLRYMNEYYAQTSEQLPLQDLPFKIATWREWREQHPDTDVYTGATPQREVGAPADNPPASPDQP